MRVLTVNERTYYINLGILEAMRDHGYTLKVLPLGDYPRDQQRQILQGNLREFEPDYVLTPGWSVGIFDTDEFLSVMDSSVYPHVYWATEDPLFFSDVSMVFAPHSSYVFTTAEECVKRYREMGLHSSTLLFGCNPRLFRPVPPKPQYQHDIILVANNYTWFDEGRNFRAKTIHDVVRPLIERGYDISIWGCNWSPDECGMDLGPRWGGFCDYLDTPHAYSSAKIVLGLQSVNTSRTQTSCRTFEIMGSGAFLLTCYTPSHEYLFENHRHLVWSDSPEATVELVDYYLSHDLERQAIAAAGRAEVLLKHTYEHRLTELEKALNPHLIRRMPRRGTRKSTNDFSDNARAAVHLGR